MSHWIIYGILIYVIYRLVKGVVFPALHISSMVNNKMKDMQQRMQEMEQQQLRQQERRNKKKEGDYIDYEEIK